MAETLRERMVRGYAWSIYLDGMRKFETTAEGYHEEIKQYAAANFTEKQITNTYNQGWITEDNYNQTMAHKETEHPITEE